jgi:hypothetical protein
LQLAAVRISLLPLALPQGDFTLPYSFSCLVIGVIVVVISRRKKNGSSKGIRLTHQYEFPIHSHATEEKKKYRIVALLLHTARFLSGILHFAAKQWRWKLQLWGFHNVLWNEYHCTLTTSVNDPLDDAQAKGQ